jgi:hypothetical protein
MSIDRKIWTLLFVATGIFNFCMGGPIFFAPGWSCQLAYYIDPADAATLRFWGDFGFAVLLIGVGYIFVALDIDKNIGIVWLGIFAKLFDVIVLSVRWSEGLAHAIVLFPAAIDDSFVLAFVLFLWRARSASSNHQVAVPG